MLVVLLLGQFMVLIDVTIVNVAMPRIGRDLHASAADAKSDWKQNGRIVRRLREALQLALILLLFEIVAWLVSIAEARGT